MSDALPRNVDHDALRRIADALEALVELKRKEATDDLRPSYARAKDPAVWKTCRRELLRLLDEYPYVDWERARSNAVLRDPASGNVYRSVQWQRFLSQHAIPNKPDDASGVVLVALDRPDKVGPSVIARTDSLHCARAAYDKADSGWAPWRWESYTARSSECHHCEVQEARLRAPVVQVPRGRPRI